MKRNILFLLSIVFFLTITTATAFAQMQPTTLYSDAWGDDNYIYGSGTTTESPNVYNHQMRAQAYLYSPGGRTNTYDTGYSYSSTAVASTVLPFDENDLGDYREVTNHYDYCPIAYAYYTLGYTTATVDQG